MKAYDLPYSRKKFAAFLETEANLFKERKKMEAVKKAKRLYRPFEFDLKLKEMGY